MIENIEKKPDEELVKIAGSWVIGTPSGAEAQQAQAELTKRLINSNKDLSKSTKFSSRVMIGLTIVLVILTLVLIAQGF